MLKCVTESNLRSLIIWMPLYSDDLKYQSHFVMASKMKNEKHNSPFIILVYLFLFLFFFFHFFFFLIQQPISEQRRLLTLRGNDLLAQSSTETLLDLLKSHAGIKDCSDETVLHINGVCRLYFFFFKKYIYYD